jgi:hypothetical protein
LNKIIIIIPIIAVAVGFIAISEFTAEKRIDKTVFHVTLADPKMYQNGVYTDMFVLETGEYFFRFVPNGDSPKSLSISLTGENFNFDENFRLNGTSHESEISQYFTWDYDGEKKIVIDERQDIFIQINPDGNILGPVSVDILQN